MSRITVLGGTGYAGSAIVREAASRGHEVTALSTRAPEVPVEGVHYVQGDAADAAVLSGVIPGSDVVVSALAPRGPLAGSFRDVNRTVARLADAASARLVVVGGFSSLRPAPGADRFIADVASIPEAFRDEVLTGAAVVVEDLPTTPDSLDWLFVSPPLGFGSYTPREPIGSYALGGEVAVEPTGGAISVDDYALAVVDLIERDEHHRAQVNVGNPA